MASHFLRPAEGQRVSVRGGVNKGQRDTVPGGGVGGCIARDLQVGLAPGSLSVTLSPLGVHSGVELKVFLPGTASGGKGVKCGAAWLMGWEAEDGCLRGDREATCGRSSDRAAQREHLTAFSRMFWCLP